MEGIIFFIIYIVVLFTIIGKVLKKANAKKPTQPNVPHTYNNSGKQGGVDVIKELSKVASGELSEAQKRYQQRLKEYQATGKTPVSNQQVKSLSQKAQAPKQDIVSKAKENAGKLKEDTTLKELEASHGHSHAQVPEKVEHSAVCQSQEKKKDVILPEESLLGSVEDLMVKGYSGNLQFERDFVGEALDMITNFTISGVAK